MENDLELSATQAETSDEPAITLDVVVLDIGQKALATADQLHQASAGVVVALVRLQMCGQVVDPLSEQGYLDLWRARVGVVEPVLGDGGGLLLHIGSTG